LSIRLAFFCPLHSTCMASSTLQVLLLLVTGSLRRRCVLCCTHNTTQHNTTAIGAAKREPSRALHRPPSPACLVALHSGGRRCCVREPRGDRPAAHWFGSMHAYPMHYTPNQVHAGAHPFCRRAGALPCHLPGGSSEWRRRARAGGVPLLDRLCHHQPTSTARARRRGAEESQSQLVVVVPIPDRHRERTNDM
jgi:hypothetical protein